MISKGLFLPLLFCDSMMSLWSWLASLYPLFPYTLTRHHNSTFKVLLAFLRSLSAIVSRVALSCPQHSAGRNTQFSNTLATFLASLQPASSLAAVREETKCFGLDQAGVRADGCHGHGVVQPPIRLQHPWGSPDFCFFLHLSDAVVHFTTLWGMWLSLGLFLPVRFDWRRSVALNNAGGGTDGQPNRLLP